MIALDKLSGELRKMFGDARLTPQDVVVETEIRLWLLDPETALRRFSAAEMEAIAASPAYWSLCWPAGQWLAAAMTADPARVRGRSVLDVGWGGGVVAMAAARAGAASVVACDSDPVALEAVLANAALNGLQGRITPAGHLPEGVRFDVVILADVLYDPSNLGLVDLALGCGSEVWIADSRALSWQDARFRHAGVYAGRCVPRFVTGPDFSQVGVWESTRGA